MSRPTATRATLSGLRSLAQKLLFAIRENLHTAGVLDRREGGQLLVSMFHCLLQPWAPPAQRSIHRMDGLVRNFKPTL